ncbi:HNH endonuclease [Mycolicibacterium brisbanense]
MQTAQNISYRHRMCKCVMVDDPLLLGQRVVAILETGQRDATYKLATLMGLIEHCIENLPPEPEDHLPVPLHDLAHRVLAIYWRQVRTFDGHVLLQRRTGAKARILDATQALRTAAGAGNSGLSLEVAKVRVPEDYQAAIDKVVIAMAKQPLPRLQKLPGATTSEPFLYDDSFLGENVSRKTLRAHGDAIEMMPGVAHGLARLAGLLKPALEIMWVEDVRRMNKFLKADVPDVAGHLFGRDRTALAVVRAPFKEAFGPHCFYCDTHLPDDNPIDHVLPWSLVGIDGLANLVLACRRCNGDKTNALPAISIVGRALDHKRCDKLEQISDEIRWPTERMRVVAAARGIYRGQPSGVPTWTGYKASTRLDIAFPPWWAKP